MITARTMREEERGALSKSQHCRHTRTIEGLFSVAPPGRNGLLPLPPSRLAQPFAFLLRNGAYVIA